MIWLDEGGRQRGVRLIAAPHELSAVVEHVWVHGALPKTEWRVVPDVSAHVIFSVTRGARGAIAACRVVGARSRFADIDMKGREVTIGARLRPGALSVFVRDDALLLMDRSVPADQIVGGEARAMVERMADASYDVALETFTQFLARRFGLAMPAVSGDLIRHSNSVADLARTLGLSRRRTYERFSTSVGLSPKTALRIHRLHRALAWLNTGAGAADAAARAGYCDQSHFTRDASRLLGEPPTAWRQRGCPFIQDKE